MGLVGGGDKGSKDNAPALVSRYRRGTTPTLASLRVRSRVKLAARLGLRGRGAMERAGEGGEDSSPLETRKVRPVVFAEHQGGGGGRRCWRGGISPSAANVSARLRCPNAVKRRRPRHTASESLVRVASGAPSAARARCVVVRCTRCRFSAAVISVELRRSHAPRGRSDHHAR